MTEAIRTNLTSTIPAGSTITITISTARNRGPFDAGCFCNRYYQGYTSGPASDPNHLYGLYFYSSGTTIPSSSGTGVNDHLTVTPQVILTCPSGVDTWMTQTVTYVTPVSVSKVAIGFFSPSGNNPSGTRYFTIDEVSITANPCGACSTPTPPTSATYTWTGCVDNDWFDPCNWDTGTVPTSTKSVIIPNTTNKPLISGATANCFDITIQSSLGARLDLNSTGGGVLNIHAP